PVSVQLLSVQPQAPPPSVPSSRIELPVSVELISVPPAAPPPETAAELQITTQLETTTFVVKKNPSVDLATQHPAPDKVTEETARWQRCPIGQGEAGEAGAIGKIHA